jgi:RHS repeat-associated protein
MTSSRSASPVCRSWGGWGLAAGAILLVFAPARAAEEGVHELRLPQQLVETEPTPETAFELPPSSYPLHHVEQLPFHGAWHGFVNSTTGGLVFRMPELKLPGRMPIDFGRIYDSKVSDSLPPPPPGGEIEARWTQDLGKNWILGYTAYLVQSGVNYTMATVDGDVIRWAPQGGGVYKPSNATASKHMVLTSTGPYTFVETQTDGTKWTFTYGVVLGATHALTKIEDRSGNYIEMIYGAGRLQTIHNSDGASITLTHDNLGVNFPAGRVVQIDDSAGRTIHLDYNTAGQLTEVEDVLGNTWTFTYGSNQKLTSATDPLGNVYLDATYDSNNRIATYEADQGPWSFSYSGAHTYIMDAQNHTWDYQHTTLGITFKVIEPTGGVHTLTFDTQRNPTGYTDPMGATTAWTYNASHMPTSYRPAWSPSASISFTYNSTTNWVNTVTAVNGGVTTFTRDSYGRVTQEQNAVGAKWTATYNTQGDRLTLKLPNGNAPGGTGHQWSFGYDTLGEVTTATDPTGRVFEFEYSDAGDLYKIRKPDHHDQENDLVQAEWTYDRDLVGRITGITDPLGHTWTRTYDDAGRLVTIEGPAGTRVDYGYDAHFRVTSAKLEGGANDSTTTYGYDSAGRMTTKSMPTGSTWTYGYDGSSRLASVTDPLNRAWNYARDAAGRITSTTHPGNQQVTMTRDTTGRLTQRAFPGGRAETFTYNTANGRLATVQATEESGAWLGRIEWLYDLLERPTSVKTIIDHGSGPLSRNLAFGYDPDGNRTTLQSTPAGETLSYSYDELDRLIGTNSDLYDDWSIEYDPDSGHRTHVESGARFKTWSWDMAGRFIGEQWDWPDHTSGNATHVRDAEGRVVSSYDTVTGVTLEVELNPLGLVDLLVSGQSGTQYYTEYSYDEAGQLTGRTTTLGDDTVEELVFGHDAAGRLNYARRNDVIREYTWEDAPADAPGVATRLWRAPMSNVEATAEIQYGFDGRLQKVTRHVAGESPMLVMGRRWSPLASDRALERTDFIEEETYDTRAIAQDIGGYYGELAEDFTVSALAQPVLEVDRASEGLEAPYVGSLPDAPAPFALGAFNAPDNLARPTLAGYVTGLLRGRLERGVVLATEERGTGGLEGLASATPIAADVLDNWLEGDLHANGLRGDSTLLPGYASSGDNGPITAGGIIFVNKGEAKAFCSCQGPVDVMLKYDDKNCCAPPPFTWDPPALPGMPPVYEVIVCDYGFSDNKAFPESLRNPDVSDGGVSRANGELIQAVTDLVVESPDGPVAFTRTYRSAVGKFGALGPKWMHNWDQQLVIGTGNHPLCGNLAKWIMPDGKDMNFSITTAGDPVPTSSDSMYRLFKRPPVAGKGQYEIRGMDGTSLTFTAIGYGSSFYQLTRWVDGPQDLTLSYSAGRLVDIGPLHIRYYSPTSSQIFMVCNKTDCDQADEYVTYSYTGTELTKVEYFPPTHLVPGSTENKTRTTLYAYSSINPADSSTPAYGQHMLTKVSALQSNPMTQNSLYETTMRIGYYNRPGGASDPNHLKVAWQCFGKDCDIQPPLVANPLCMISSDHVADLTFDYSAGTVTTDCRLLPQQSKIERRVYDKNNLVSLIEDWAGDLERETIYEYNAQSLLKKISYPDGTSRSTEYENVSEIWMPTREALIPASANDPQQVTVTTYEPFRGRVRTVTTPEAFPNGVVPSNFNPTAEPYARYTTQYYYDFDETGSQGGEKESILDSACTDWNICIGPRTGAENGVAEDNENTFGRLVKTTHWIPEDPEHPIALSTTAYDGHGRPIVETRPDGVQRELRYYKTATSTDWRGGSEFTDYGATGDGPLAAEVGRPIGWTPPLPQHPDGRLWTKYAWTALRKLKATQDPQGVLTENTLAPDGALEEQRICSPTCADDVLRRTQFTYDLRGRTLREVTYDPELAEPIREVWTTYDTLGRQLTVTLDPQPGPTHLQLASQTQYDGRGRVTKTVSPAGRVVCFGYDNLDRQKWTRRQNALTQPGDCPTAPLSGDMYTSVTYDAVKGYLTSATDGTLTTTYYAYDSYGRTKFVSGSPNPPGAATWYRETTYDLANRPTRERFFGRQDVSSGNSPSGFLQVTWKAYDTVGRPISTGIAIDYPFVVNAANNPTAPSTGVVNSFVYYDSSGRRNRIVDAGGRVTDISYDDFGRPATVTLPIDNYVCEYTPSQSCLQASECGSGACGPADRNTQQTFYDSAGRPWKTETTIHDPQSQAFTRVNRIEYDTWGRVQRSIGAPTATQNVQESQDPEDPPPGYQPEDLVMDSVFDALGRVTKTIRRWGQASSPWDPSPQGSDRVTESQFDMAGRITKTRMRIATSPSEVWAETQFGYDRDGLSTSMMDGELRESQWIYDPLGHLTRMLYPQEGSNGQQVVEYVGRDGVGRPTQVEFRASATSTDPRVTWSLQYYNALGVLKSRTATASDPSMFFGTTSQHFAYDDLGRVIRAEDHSPGSFSSAEEQIRAEFHYDTAGRKLEENQLLPLGSVLAPHYVDSEYAPDGFRTKLLFPQPTGAVDRYTIKYTPDSAGRLSLIEAPSVPADPLSGDSRPMRDMATYEYVGNQVWRRWSGNNVETRMFEDTASVGHRPVLFDGIGRLRGMRIGVQLGGVLGTPIADFRYDYDPVGTLTYEQRKHEQVGAQSPPRFRTRAYTKDLMGRLTEWREGDATAATPTTFVSTSDTETWSLDRVGNWVTHKQQGSVDPADTFARNALNQYVSMDPHGPNAGDSVKSFTFDWLGQMRQSQARNQKYVWDMFGRLTQVRKSNGTYVCSGDGTTQCTSDIGCLAAGGYCGDLVARYRYDAFNRRVEKFAPGASGTPDPITRFVYDGWRAIEERAVVTAGSPQEIVRARYGFGLGLDEVLWMDRDVARNNSVPDPILGSPDNVIEGRYFVHHDILGNAIAVTDDPASGSPAVIERFTYSGYGAVAVWNSDWLGNAYTGAPTPWLSSVGLPYLYTGQRFDVESGLHYYKHRFYDPTVGRFLTRDQMGYSDGTNLYQYAKSNPALATDPLGLITSYEYAAYSTMQKAFPGAGMSGPTWKGSSMASSSGAKGPVQVQWNQGLPTTPTDGPWTPGVGGAVGWGDIPCYMCDGPAANPTGGPIDIGYVENASVTAEDPWGILFGQPWFVLDWVIGENSGAAWRDDVFGGEWGGGPTGGFMPKNLALDIDLIHLDLPKDAGNNGFHAWHAASNTHLTKKLGLAGVPLILIFDLLHELPTGDGSFSAEQQHQGSVNHFLDSTMDMVANVYGVVLGLTGYSVPVSAFFGNYVPGPADTDKAFGGRGNYQGNPSDAWGEQGEYP